VEAGKNPWDRLFETPNFFGKYRHFIVLEASAHTEQDQLDWYGLVESKVRHLVAYLEREAIELAHVWPKTYPCMEEGREKTCCYWFVGLVIKSGEAGLNLTLPIKQFTELVMRSATAIEVWKEGMKVDANYSKRKQLASYLPPSERHKLKVSRPSIPSPSTTPSTPSAATTTTTAPSTPTPGAPATPARTTPPSTPQPSDASPAAVTTTTTTTPKQPPVVNANKRVHPEVIDLEVSTGEEGSPVKRVKTSDGGVAASTTAAAADGISSSNGVGEMVST